MHAEVLVCAEVCGDHVRKVMRIDDYFVNAEGAESRQCKFQERAASDFNECLGAIIGQRAQTRAQAGSENHRLHSAALSGKFFSSSMWRTTTSTPLLNGGVARAARREIPIGAGLRCNRKRP